MKEGALSKKDQSLGSAEEPGETSLCFTACAQARLVQRSLAGGHSCHAVHC